ncbi:MAG: hypothetical protein ACI4TF_02925 [Oliverpabstia sp.]
MSTGEALRGEGADKVPGYTYDIVLKTEIGERKGQLVLDITENIVKGCFKLLGFSLPCSGIIDKNGNCSLQGQLKTFMSTYDYIGAGYADENRVDVVLNSGKKRFYMTGTVTEHRD